MNRKNVIIFVAALVVGLIIGGGIVLMWHNSSRSLNKPPHPKPLLEAGRFWRINLYESQVEAMNSIPVTPDLVGFRLDVDPCTIWTPTETIKVFGIDSHNQVIPGTDRISYIEGRPSNFVRIYLFMKELDALKGIQGTATLAVYRLTQNFDAAGHECINISGFNSQDHEISGTFHSIPVDPCPPNCDVL